MSDVSAGMAWTVCLHSLTLPLWLLLLVGQESGRKRNNSSLPVDQTEAAGEKTKEEEGVGDGRSRNVLLVAHVRSPPSSFFPVNFLLLLQLLLFSQREERKAAG